MSKKSILGQSYGDLKKIVAKLSSTIEGPEGGEDEDVQGGLAVVQEGDLVIAIVGIKRDLLSRTVELCSVSLLPHMVSELWELRLTFRWQRPGATNWELL